MGDCEHEARRREQPVECTDRVVRRAAARTGSAFTLPDVRGEGRMSCNIFEDELLQKLTASLIKRVTCTGEDAFE